MSNIHRLKVKNLSLAQEARIIRKMEVARRKYKKRLSDEYKKKLEELSGISDGTYLPPHLKGIRKYTYVESRNHKPEVVADLREHRLKVVKPEARATHLALGFLKNMPYRAMENLAYTSPDWKRVWTNIIRFGGIAPSPENYQKFMDWADRTLDTAGPKHNQPVWDYTKVHNRTPSEFIRIHVGWSL
jgi:hypothetical protein